MSYVYSINMRGPRIDPCGIPSSNEYIVFMSFGNTNFLSVMYLMSRSVLLVSNPSLFSFVESICLLTVSKAFDRSMKMAIDTWLILLFLCIVLT